MRISKDPDAVLDYSVNWSHWLDGDEIATSTWIVPDGLTQATDTFTKTLATVWISGGTADVEYTVTNRITTVAGRTDDRSMILVCRER